MLFDQVTPADQIQDAGDDPKRGAKNKSIGVGASLMAGDSGQERGVEKREPRQIEHHQSMVTVGLGGAQSLDEERCATGSGAGHTRPMKAAGSIRPHRTYTSPCG